MKLRPNLMRRMPSSLWSSNTRRQKALGQVAFTFLLLLRIPIVLGVELREEAVPSLSKVPVVQHRRQIKLLQRPFTSTLQQVQGWTCLKGSKKVFVRRSGRLVMI